jgi:hypothetical protein
VAAPTLTPGVLIGRRCTTMDWVRSEFYPASSHPSGS